MQVMTMANWNDDFYDVYAGSLLGTQKAVAFFYFALLILLGNWMLLNLFVAILLQEFFMMKEQVCVCVCVCVPCVYFVCIYRSRASDSQSALCTHCRVRPKP
jgi:hypothetical protein